MIKCKIICVLVLWFMLCCQTNAKKYYRFNPFRPSLIRFFDCKNGQEIKYDKKCDQVPDCSDGSDEGNICECNSPEIFSCQFENECIFIENLCDISMDCSNGLDEVNCPAQRCHGFRCRNGACLMGSAEMNYGVPCNWKDDCFDASDEYFCRKWFIVRACLLIQVSARENINIGIFPKVVI